VAPKIILIMGIQKIRNYLIHDHLRFFQIIVCFNLSLSPALPAFRNPSLFFRASVNHSLESGWLVVLVPVTLLLGLPRGGELAHLLPHIHNVLITHSEFILARRGWWGCIVVVHQFRHARMRVVMIWSGGTTISAGIVGHARVGPHERRGGSTAVGIGLSMMIRPRGGGGVQVVMMMLLLLLLWTCCQLR